jgi:hypothetical protein
MHPSALFHQMNHKTAARLFALPLCALFVVLVACELHPEMQDETQIAIPKGEIHIVQLEVPKGR